MHSEQNADLNPRHQAPWKGLEWTGLPLGVCAQHPHCHRHCCLDLLLSFFPGLAIAWRGAPEGRWSWGNPVPLVSAMYSVEITVEKDKVTGETRVLSSTTLLPRDPLPQGVKVYEDETKGMRSCAPCRGAQQSQGCALSPGPGSPAELGLCAQH